jgi:hypothetical protein
MTTTEDSKINSVFEVLGSYFVDVFFNHIYNSAKSARAGQTSLTDEYIRRVSAYSQAIKTDQKCYNDTVAQLHTYFRAKTRFTTINFNSFVDSIVGPCIPEEHFRQCTNEAKDVFLGVIVCELVSSLVSTTTEPAVLRNIIDKRKENHTATTRMLQDTAVITLQSSRHSLLNKMLTRAGTSTNLVSLEQLRQMRDSMRLINDRLQAAQAESKKLRIELQASRGREARLHTILEDITQKAGRHPPKDNPPQPTPPKGGSKSAPKPTPPKSAPLKSAPLKVTPPRSDAQAEPDSADKETKYMSGTTETQPAADTEEGSSAMDQLMNSVTQFNFDEPDDHQP